MTPFSICLFIFVCFVSVVPYSLACNVSPIRLIQQSASYRDNVVESFGNASTQAPFFEISNCNPNSARPYFGLLLAPIFYDSKSNRQFSSMGQLRDPECRIEDNPFSEQLNFAEELAEYRLRIETLNTCMVMQLEDTENASINFPEQTLCEVTYPDPANESKVYAKGELCYFLPQTNSKYRVYMKVLPECLEREHLVQNYAQGKFQLTDIPSFVNFFTSNVILEEDYEPGDGQPEPQISLLHVAESWVNFESGDEVMPTAETYNMPVWPAQWAPDIHLGTVRVQRAGSARAKLSASFLVRNKCESSCKDGLCAGPCDYSTSVFGQVFLFRINPGKKDSYIGQIYSGGLVPARWMGELNSAKQSIDGLQIEGCEEEDTSQCAQYRLVARFGEPWIDFRTASSRLKPILLGIVNEDNDAFGELTPIPGLGGLSNLSDIPFLPNLDVGGSSAELSLSGLFEFAERNFWPPFYTQGCDPANLSNCTRLKGGVRHVELEATFHFVKDGRNYFAKGVRVQRRSSFLPEYSREYPNGLPKVVCGD